MNLEKTIEQLALKAMEDTDLFLVDLVANSSGNKFRVLVDGDHGVSIGQCALISRAISRQLDEMDLPEQAFTYEVSSPGADLPLKLLRQYHKHLGRTLEVKLSDSEIVQGVLTAVNEGEIELSPEPVKGYAKKKKESTEVEIPRLIPVNEIKETKVVLKFK